MCSKQKQSIVMMGFPWAVLYLIQGWMYSRWDLNPLRQGFCEWVNMLSFLSPRTPIAIWTELLLYFCFAIVKLLFSVCLLRIFADSMLIAVNDYRHGSIGIEWPVGRSVTQDPMLVGQSLYIYRDSWLWKESTYCDQNIRHELCLSRLPHSTML